MKAYPKYKNSGIPSLGLIPEDWHITKMKYVADLFTGNSLNDSQKEQYSQICEDSYPYVATKDVTFGNEPANYDNGVWIPKDEPRFKLAPKDSFLLCVEGGSAGRKMTYLDRDVCFVNKLCCFVSQLNPRYHYYYIQSQAFGSIFKQSLQGLIGGVSISDLEKFPIVVPTLAEQEAIAAYLDEKTAKIDECVNFLELQKTDLRAFLSAVVSEVITRGLNKNINYKETDIIGVGVIPVHWKVAKTLVALSMPITDGPHETPTFYEEGIPFVSAEAVSFGNGEIDFGHARGYISQSYYEECCKKYTPQRNDIFMIKSGATTGRVAIVNTDRLFTIWSPLAVFRCNPDVMFNKFLYYMLQTDFYQKQVQLGWSFGTQQNIGMRTLEKLKIVIPPISEQIAIAEYIDRRKSRIDEAIHRIDEQINDLRAYRTALISEVVTGKIDVRNN